MRRGKLFAVVGSPGGSLIINYVMKTLVALIDWKLDPQVAVDLPNFGSRNGPTELEAGTEAEAWKPALEAKGHAVKLIEMTSGIQAIVITADGFTGGADLRREGVAIRNGDIILDKPISNSYIPIMFLRECQFCPSPFLQ